MIKLQNKISVESSSSSMSDLVFLLLIFFMITSTLISPNAIPLNLPESSSDTRVKQDLTVYITYNPIAYYLGTEPFDAADLRQVLTDALAERPADAAIVLRADKEVPVEQIVYTLDAVEQINAATDGKHKVTLATKS